MFLCQHAVQPDIFMKMSSQPEFVISWKQTFPDIRGRFCHKYDLMFNCIACSQFITAELLI